MRTVVLCLFLAAGCAGTSRGHVGSAPRGRTGLLPRHQAAFTVLEDAVEAREDGTARRVAERLRTRLEIERGVEGDAEAVDNALALLAGFERILYGRALVDSLELELVLRTAQGGALDLHLRARTTRETRIELRPGAAELRMHRVTLTVPDGKEARTVRTQGVGGLEALPLDSQGWAEVSLGRFPARLPGNAIAARSSYRLTLRAGTIVEEGRAYPAMEVPPVVVQRVELAPYLPTEPVDPAELAAYAQRSEGSLPALLERTVRIEPSRRDEALELLRPVVARMTPEEVARIVPSLRWLAPTARPGRDPEAWRLYLEHAGAGRDSGGGALEFGSDR